MPRSISHTTGRRNDGAQKRRGAETTGRRSEASKVPPYEKSRSLVVQPGIAWRLLMLEVQHTLIVTRITHGVKGYFCDFLPPGTINV